MLKFLQKMLLIAALCVPWVTQAQSDCTPISTFPVTYGFEASEGFTTTVTAAAACTTNVFNSCWRNEQTSFSGSTGSGRIWHIYGGTTSTYLHGGSHTLMLPDKGSTSAVSTTMLTFPAMNFTNAGGYVVSFWICRNGTGTSTPEGVKIYASPTDTIGPGAVEIGQYSRHRTLAYPCIESASGWYQYETAPITMTGTVYIIFEGQSYYGSSTYIDDVVIMEAPTCPRVDSLSVVASTNDAVVSWVETGSATDWEVTVSDATSVVSSTIVSSIPATISNLDGNTQYTVDVRAVCGIDDTSMVRSTTFRTLCTDISTLPYSYGFEDLATGSSTAHPNIPCWNHINNGTSYFGYPYVSSTTPHSGTRNLYWYGSTTATTYGDYQIVVLPGIDTNIYPMNTLQLTFWARPTSTSYHPVFQVGVMSDPTDVSTFQLVQTVNVQNVTTWQEFTVMFGSYTGTGKYMAVRLNRPSSSYYVYTDDFTIGEMPNCPTIISDHVITTAASAYVTWDYDHNFGGAPDGYSVSYGYTNDDVTSYTTTTTTDPEITLSLLDPDSAYTMIVRPVCDNVPDIPYEISFSTVALPCLEWDTTGGSGGNSSPVATYVVGTPGSSTTNVMPVNGGYNYSYCNHLIRRSDISAVPSGTTYISGIDFQYAASSPMVSKTNCTIYMCHTTMTTCDNFATPSDLVLVYEGPLNCTTNGWNHFEFNRGTFAYNGTSNIIVAIVDNSGATDANESFYYEAPGVSVSHRVYRNDSPYSFADLGTVTASNSMWRTNMRLTTGGNGGDGDCLTPLSCAAPAVTLETSLSGDIELSWIPGYQETSWDVDYRVSGTSTWTNAVSGTNSTDATILLSDLQPNTHYEFRVTALCSDSNMSAIVAYTTPCSFISIPYSYGFEDMATTSSSSHPNIPCWHHLNNGTSYPGYPYVSSSTPHSGSRNLYWYLTTTTGTYGDYEVIVLPPVDASVTPVNTLQLSFWARPTSTSYSPIFYVGVMTDPTDITTFQYVDTINVNHSTTDWMIYESMLNNFNGTGNYVAIRANRPSSAWYAYLDDVTLDFIPLCPRVEDLTATYVSLDSITVSWNDTSSTNTSWYIEFDTVMFTPGDVNANPISVADTFYTLDNLDSATTYYIYVYPDCADGVYPRMISVTTLAAAPAITPYYCDFEEDGPNGWDLLGQNQTNYWIVDSATHNGGSRSLYITNNGFANEYTNNAISYSYAIRTFNLSDAGEYAYSYDWKGTGESHYYDFTRVFVTPASEMFTAGDVLGGSTYAFSTAAAPASWIELTQSGETPNTLAQQSTWTTVTGTFGIVNPGNYKMVFIWANDGSGGTNPPTAIDNVSLVRNTCGSVENLTVLYVTEDSAIIGWNTLPEHNSYIFEYDSVPFSVGNASFNDLVIGDSTYVLTGLSAGVTYYVSVRSECNGDTSLANTLNFTTLAGPPATVPYFCDFENNGVNGWDLVNGTEPNYWMVGNATGNNGRSLYVTDNGTANSYSGDESYAFATRTFNLTEAGEYAFSYDWKCNGESSYDFLRAALVPASTQIVAGSYCGFNNGEAPSGTMPAGGIALDGGGRLNQQTSWQTKTGTFNITTPGTYVWVFLWRNDGSVYNTPPAAIDNVSISRNTCPAPFNVTSAYASTDSIIISWIPGGTETSWEVTYDSGSFVVTDTFYVADNLTANTDYAFRVRAICSDSDTSLPASYSVRTDCGAITVLPYMESFEGLPAGTSSNLDCGVPCWARLDNATQYHFGYVGSPSSWPSGAHTGSGFLYYYMPTTTGTYADWILTILPPIDTVTYPMNNLQVSFWVKMNSASTVGDIQVGVISNTNDATSFVPLDTVHVAGDVYDLKTAYLSGYAGGGAHIALKYTRNASTTTYYFVDDITVEPMPDCPPVTNITLGGLDSNMLTVTWTENGSATSWDVEYGPTGFTLGNGTTVTVTANTITVTGLTPNTDYDFYITPECTGGTSATRMGTFRTANTYVQLPFSCDFENATQNTLWTLENGSLTNKWYIGNGTNNGGSNALYISDNNGTSCNYTITSSTMVYAFADIMLPVAGDYSYSFDWKSYGESTLDYIRAALVPASVTLTAGTSVPSGFNSSSLPSGWIAIDGGSKLNLQTNWQTRSDVITVTSAGVYHLVFAFRCDGSVGTQPPAAIDNVVIAQLTCSRPDNVTISNLTQTSADISWDETGTATMWEYQLDNNASVIVNDTFCSFNNLTSNTPYTFRVRSICGAGDTSFWKIYSFRTPCGYLTLPYTQDFESENTGSSTTGSAFANCWTRLNNGTSYGGYPYISSSTTYNHTVGGTKGLYWYNSTTAGTYGDYQCVVLPPVDPNTGVDSLQLSFWAKASSTSYVPVFQIGVMTDPNNINTFVGVDTITVTTGTTWMNIEVPLSTYTGNGQYVAVKADRGTSYWYAYVDDFLLDYVPTCLAPRDIVATATSTTTIDIDWTDLSQPTAWEISYGHNANNTTTVVAYNHPYTISGLDTLTSYIFKVRAICGAGDTSYWSMATTLSTSICDNSIEATTGPASGTQYYTPLNNFYNYTLTETIIDSAELAEIGDIIAIAYSYNNTSASTVKTNVSIYLKPTTKTVFSSSSDIELLDSTAVKVYEGPLNCSQGWNYFTFDTLYTWDGQSNLMVIVDDNSGVYDGSAYVFNSSSCTGYKTLVWYSDSYNPDPYSSSFSGTKTYNQYRATMMLVSCGGARCLSPNVLPTTDITYQSATINWNSNATDFEVAVRAATDAEYPAPTSVTGATSYTVSGLQPATIYRYQVRAICDATEELISDWVEGTFTTDSLPCFAPTDLHTTDLGYTTATLAWTAGGAETMWNVHVWNTTKDTNFTTTGNPYTVTGLAQTTTYYAAISALCGNGTVESEYSDTIQFTTATCAVPTAVTTSNITATSVTVSWNGTAQSYEIEYGDRNFNRGEGTKITVNNSTTYQITGLESEHMYTLYVRSICETGLMSDYSSQVDFDTPAGEGFDAVNGGMNVSIYPNPTTSATTIALSGVNGEVSITIVDMNGRIVMSDSMSCEGDCTKTMEVSGLAQGAYFVRLNGDNVNMVKKLVVK